MSSTNVQDFVASLGDNTPLGDDAIGKLASGLFQKLPSRDLKSLLGSVTGQMPANDMKDVAAGAVSQLGDEHKTEVVKQAINGLPEAERKDVVASLVPVVGKPDSKTADFIWRVIVITFSLVLLGTVAGLIITMFNVPAAGGTKPELILAIITSVIGFLAGLVSPSPVQK